MCRKELLPSLFEITITCLPSDSRNQVPPFGSLLILQYKLIGGLLCRLVKYFVGLLNFRMGYFLT